MAKYASLTTRTARLSDDFGLDYATKLFGAETVASLPILQLGPNKGKPKGVLHWRRADVGGWSRDHGMAVATGSLVDAWIAEHQGMVRSAAMSGQWLGRNQTLAGSSTFLGPEARARHMAEQERLEAQWRQELAEIKAENAQ